MQRLKFAGAPSIDSLTHRSSLVWMACSQFLWSSTAPAREVHWPSCSPRPFVANLQFCHGFEFHLKPGRSEAGLALPQDRSLRTVQQNRHLVLVNTASGACSGTRHSGRRARPSPSVASWTHPFSVAGSWHESSPLHAQLGGL